jgi:hypothetical protein
MLLGAGGSTGLASGLDLFGVETLRERVGYLQERVATEEQECRATMNSITEQCREEIEWLRERCE